MKLDARRYPHVTQLMAALKIDRLDEVSEHQGGKYTVTFHMTTDLSHLMPKNPTENDLDDLADKLDSVTIEKKLNKELWQAVRHEIDWAQTVDVTNIEMEPYLQFGESAEQMRESLKKTKLVVTIEVLYEMPSEVRNAADGAIEKFLKSQIEGISF